MHSATYLSNPSFRLRNKRAVAELLLREVTFGFEAAKRRKTAAHSASCGSSRLGKISPIGAKEKCLVQNHLSQHFLEQLRRDRSGDLGVVLRGIEFDDVGAHDFPGNGLNVREGFSGRHSSRLAM